MIERGKVLLRAASRVLRIGRGIRRFRRDERKKLVLASALMVKPVSFRMDLMCLGWKFRNVSACFRGDFVNGWRDLSPRAYLMMLMRCRLLGISKMMWPPGDRIRWNSAKSFSGSVK